jgi:hypothetical protein
MAGQVAPIDLWGVFNAAAESSRARRLDAQRQAQMEHESARADQAFQLQQDQQKAAQEQANMQREALTRAQGGQTGMLQLLFPAQYGEFQKQQLDQRKTESEIAQQQNTAQIAAQKSAEDRARNTAALKLSVASQVANNPASAPRVQSFIDQMAEAGRIDGFQIPGIHTLPDGMAGPQILVPNRPEVRQLGQTAIADVRATNAPLNQLDDKLVGEGLVPGTQEAEQRAHTLNEKSGGLTVNMPGALGNGTREKIQQALEKDQILLAELDDIEALGDPGQFLGLKNQVKNFTLGTLAGLDPGLVSAETRDQLGKARQFKEGVERIYLAGKVEVTGASGAEKELREIRGAMLNTDLNGPDFKASFARLRHVTERNMRIRQALLRDGVDVGTVEGRKRYSSELDRAIAAEKAPKDHPPAFVERLQQEAAAGDKDAAAKLAAMQGGQ